MKKEQLKSYLLLITFSVGLILVVVKFENLIHGAGTLLKLLVPLFVGIAIAFVLNRPYEMLYRFFANKCRFKPKAAKPTAIVAVYILAVSAVALIILLVIPELIENIKQFIGSANVYLYNVQQYTNNIMDFLGLKHIDVSKLLNTVNSYLGTISQALDGMVAKIIDITSGLFSALTTGLISIALSVYILSSKEKLLMQTKRVVQAYTPRKVHGKLADIYNISVQVFEDYVAGQCKEAVILGSLCFLGMMLLRLEYAGLIGIIIGVTALVPILGAYIGGALGALLLLFISPAKSLIFLVFLVVLQQVEGNVIYPRVVGRKIGLPGMWVLLGISVGGGLFGIVGMIVAVPVTTVLYQLLKNDVVRREAIAAANEDTIEETTEDIIEQA